MKLTRVLGVIGVGVLSLTLLSGCSAILNPISDEERYQYVNTVKDNLDYRNAGEVIKEGYDKNDQYFGPSIFYSQYSDLDSFDRLSEKAVATYPDDCRIFSDHQTTCNVSGISVMIYRNFEENKVTLKITDSLNGRRN